MYTKKRYQNRIKGWIAANKKWEISENLEVVQWDIGQERGPKDNQLELGPGPL